MIEKIETKNAPLPNNSPHSQAIKVNNLVFTQGIICLTPEGTMREVTLEEQIHQIMHNLDEILKAAGTRFSKVVKTTIYVTDMESYKTVNQIYAEYMSDPFPARETVCVSALPLGATIEISMIAEC